MGGGRCKSAKPRWRYGPGCADEDVASRETEYAGAAATEAMKPLAIASGRCMPVAVSSLQYIDLNLHAQHFRYMKVASRAVLGEAGRSFGYFRPPLAVLSPKST